MRHIVCMALLILPGCGEDAAASVATDAAEDEASADVAIDVDVVPTYPAGPYGIALDQVFPNLEFDGYRAGKPPVVKLRVGDYYDPTGARGINGIHFTYTASVYPAPSCPPCDLLGSVHQKA
jgi:hypothetical protein